MTSTATLETLSLQQLAAIARERRERVRQLAETRMNERLLAIIASQR